jgi:hypothetical protein
MRQSTLSCKDGETAIRSMFVSVRPSEPWVHASWRLTSGSVYETPRARDSPRKNAPPAADPRPTFTYRGGRSAVASPFASSAFYLSVIAPPRGLPPFHTHSHSRVVSIARDISEPTRSSRKHRVHPVWAALSYSPRRPGGDRSTQSEFGCAWNGGEPSRRRDHRGSTTLTTPLSRVKGRQSIKTRWRRTGWRDRFDLARKINEGH